jgi:NhaA family Na+:H+ antiporter
VHATIAGVILGLAIPARTRTPAREVLTALSGHLSRLLTSANECDRGHAELLAIEQDLEDLQPPVERFLHALHPFVAYLVLPLFALANSGVALAGTDASVLVAPVTLGVVAGLVVGKSVGIYGLTALAVKLGLASIPGNATGRQLLGVSVIAGIGFTVALFIAGLAFAQAPALLDQAKLGIVAASLVAGVFGVVILYSVPRPSR